MRRREPAHLGLARGIANDPLGHVSANGGGTTEYLGPYECLSGRLRAGHVAVASSCAISSRVRLCQPPFELWARLKLTVNAEV